MTVFRYIFKETLKTQLAVLFILLLIFSSQQFIKILAQAASGNIPTQLIVTLLSLNLPYMALLLFPLSLFFGVLFTHGRLYAESEMTVLRAVGMGPRSVLGITLVLALITMLLATLNTMWLAPWAREAEYQLLDRARSDPTLTALVGGRFLNVDSGRLVAYVDELEEEGTGLQRVFLLQQPRDGQVPTILVADSGQLSVDENGLQWLTLKNGRRYSGPMPGQEFKVSQFEEFSAWLQQRREVIASTRKESATSVGELFHSKEIKQIAEWQWRVSLPLSILVLTLIVVPMAVVNPRQGRYAKLLPAILLYLSYFLLLSAGRSALERGTLPVFPGLYAVPVLYMLLFALPLNLAETRWWNGWRLRIKGGCR